MKATGNYELNISAKTSVDFFDCRMQDQHQNHPAGFSENVYLPNANILHGWSFAVWMHLLLKKKPFNTAFHFYFNVIFSYFLKFSKQPTNSVHGKINFYAHEHRQKEYLTVKPHIVAPGIWKEFPTWIDLLLQS